MPSYMIKISAGIAYEQNRPIGLASALNAQFGLLVKSASKITFSSDKSCYKSQYTTFDVKSFLIATKV